MHTTSEPERWLPVVGWEGLYEVSDLGRIRTVPRVVNGGRNSYKSITLKIKKQCSTPHGYPICGLSKNGKTKTFLTHRLVLEAFIGPRPDGMEACHFDGDKTNNKLANLRWDTKSSNQDDAVRIGTRPDPRRTRCSLGHQLSPENVYLNPKGIRECKACRTDRFKKYSENVQAGQRKIRRRIDIARDVCKHGHRMTPENTYINNLGLPVCRECRRISDRKYHRRKLNGQRPLS